MNNKSINSLIKQRNIVIPLYIYKLFPKLDIDIETFMFLMYLYNIDEKIIFNPKKLSDEFGITLENVLLFVNKLVEKSLVSFEIIKNDKNVSEEYLSLNLFYEKISLLLIEEINVKKSTDGNVIDKNLFTVIEKEFGRTLSPIEIEIIKAWSENNISDELILCALKEAIFSGVSNLRYIDKILYEWQKKGIKTKTDVENNKKSMIAKKEKEDKVDFFEYEWLDDDE